MALFRLSRSEYEGAILQTILNAKTIFEFKFRSEWRRWLIVTILLAALTHICEWTFGEYIQSSRSII